MHFSRCSNNLSDKIIKISIKIKFFLYINIYNKYDKKYI
jgi:hypothetical protein